MAYACLLFGCEKELGVSNAWLAAELGLEELKHRVVEDSHVYKKALSDDLQLFRTLSKTRFIPNHIADFVVIDETSRRATFAAKVDYWPIEINVQIQRSAHGWSIENFLNRQAIRNGLTLLSESGLPSINTGQPWAGGLMGHDDQGRPNSAVLISSDGNSLSIDGRPFRLYTERQAIERIKKEIRARRRAATKAFATYRPHTAIALPSHSPMRLLQRIVDWSTQAGAESIQLLARSENGPVWLPLAVIKMGGQVRSNWRLLLSSNALYLGDGTHSKKAKIGGSIKQIRPLLNALESAPSKDTVRRDVIVESQNDLEYRDFLHWMALVHRQRPDLRIGIAEPAQ